MSKMHDNELDVNLSFIRDLINEQFPQFSTLPIKPVNSVGTVNHVYRLGEELYIRLPRVEEWADIEKEWKWIPYLASRLSLKIPEPIFLGKPTASYPVNWAIYKWIEGSNYSDELIQDERESAKDLANFVNELHSLDVPADAPKAGRLPLLELHQKTLEGIEEAGDLLDRDRVLAAWEEACKASAWNGNPVWIHADLLRTNLLVHSGRLAAVIDFGGVGKGDPAFDLIPAWSIFNSQGRKVFQNSIHADKDTWLRARGYALHQAVLIIPYYRETNPQFVTQAKRTLGEILADMDSGE
ncbi:aminoglycoside phosphotransferase family protein [Niallia circulans]|uniref:Aminoglycoside phosphotransferase family protein n=1 Tax=Niallia circulans TaxID=1397 RepID=A0A553SRP5_NIACI|nr:aminoglycoside phosphotransferase family protein [Niallia circulans]TRZ39638.1 aminoglycoside phosphotransferase family protein [Niallia circulans]